VSKDNSGSPTAEQFESLNIYVTVEEGITVDNIVVCSCLTEGNHSERIQPVYLLEQLWIQVHPSVENT
jgi:hypothetical protein